MKRRGRKAEGVLRCKDAGRTKAIIYVDIVWRGAGGNGACFLKLPAQKIYIFVCMYVYKKWNQSSSSCYCCPCRF